MGATAIEYGLIASGIAVAIITVVQGLGNQAEQHVRERQRQPEVSFLRVPVQREAPAIAGAFLLFAPVSHPVAPNVAQGANGPETTIG